MCILAAEDLPTTNLAANRKELFANKLLPEADYGALYCWLRELERRNSNERRTGTVAMDRLESQSYFDELPAVRYNRARKLTPAGSSFEFKCT